MNHHDGAADDKAAAGDDNQNRPLSSSSTAPLTTTTTTAPHNPSWSSSSSNVLSWTPSASNATFILSSTITSSLLIPTPSLSLCQLKYVPPHDHNGNNSNGFIHITPHDTTQQQQPPDITNPPPPPLDILDPHDIIGAELQLDLRNIHNQRRQRLQIDDDDEDETLSAAAAATQPQHLTTTHDTTTPSTCSIFTTTTTTTNPPPSQSCTALLLPDVPRGCTSLVSHSDDYFTNDGDSYDDDALTAPTALLHVYHYPSSGKKRKRRARHVRLEVAPCDDFASVRASVRGIRAVSRLSGNYGGDCYGVAEVGSSSLATMAVGPPRYLVVGGRERRRDGRGRGRRGWVDKMIGVAGGDMLDMAGGEWDYGEWDERNKVVIINEKQQGDEPWWEGYRGVIIWGGDDLAGDVIRGVGRETNGMDVLKRLTLGVVGEGVDKGGGRGRRMKDGLGASVLYGSGEAYGVVEALFLICKGQSRPIDLAHYETKHESYTSFLSYSFGLMADIILDNSSSSTSATNVFFKKMTMERNVIYNVIKQTTYRARVSYLPPPPSSSSDDAFPAVLPNITDAVPSEWTVVEDDFILVSTSLVTHMGEGLQITSSRRLGDGLFRILLIRKRSISRYQLMKWLLLFETGGCLFDDDYCEVHSCVAFRLEPLGDGEKGGEGGKRRNVLDGVEIESGVIQAKVLRRGLNVFMGQQGD